MITKDLKYFEFKFKLYKKKPINKTNKSILEQENSRITKQEPYKISKLQNRSITKEAHFKKRTL
jgi:hypothetical protein